LTKLGFIRKFWPKRFHNIDPSEACKAHQKLERRVKELQFQQEEDRKNQVKLFFLLSIVIITIFRYFRQFWAKKIVAFSSKTNVVIKFLHNFACFESKAPIFGQFFSQKYFLNRNTSPWPTVTVDL
jgi:uncharacterized membrane protein (DUF106 family)